MSARKPSPPPKERNDSVHRSPMSGNRGVTFDEGRRDDNGTIH